MMTGIVLSSGTQLIMSNVYITTKLTYVLLMWDDLHCVGSIISDFLGTSYNTCVPMHVDRIVGMDCDEESFNVERQCTNKVNCFTVTSPWKHMDV